MVSKCLNPQCSATFRSLRDGRLFRIDFEAALRRGHSQLSSRRTRVIEDFWLCSDCAQSMTIKLDDACEVKLVKLQQPHAPLPIPPAAAGSQKVAL